MTSNRERADCIAKIFTIMCRDVNASFTILPETAMLLEKYHPELPINYIGDDGRLKPGLNAKRLM